MISTKAGLALALLLATPALAGPLVVRASGPSAAAFKPGQRLPDAPLALRAGDRITVLDASGTRSFVGPGSFRLDAVGRTAAPSGFTELLTQKIERRARIGAVRSVTAAAGPAVPPGVWAIDAGTTATVCVLDPARISLWRADPAAAASVAIARQPAGGAVAAAAVAIAFAPGQAVAPWPAALAVSDGDRFRTSGAGAPATLTIRTLAAPPAALDDLGAAFLAAGCQSQFDRLAAVTLISPS